jgi:hypothetical protein
MHDAALFAAVSSVALSTREYLDGISTNKTEFSVSFSLSVTSWDIDPSYQAEIQLGEMSACHNQLKNVAWLISEIDGWDISLIFSALMSLDQSVGYLDGKSAFQTPLKNHWDNF